MTATGTTGAKKRTHEIATGTIVDVKTLGTAIETFVIVKTLEDEAGTLVTVMTIEDGTGTAVSIARAETPREISATGTLTPPSLPPPPSRRLPCTRGPTQVLTGSGRQAHHV